MEKVLKAWLALQGVLYPRIHDLDRLLDLLRERGVDVPADFDALSALTDFGVAFRYEAYDESDDPFDRGEIIQQVEKLLHHVTELLPPEDKS